MVFGKISKKIGVPLLMAVVAISLVALVVPAFVPAYAQSTTSTTPSPSGSANTQQQPASAPTGCSFLPPNWSACIGYGFYIVNYIFATILGFGVAVMLWFIEIVLQANANVVNTTIVQTGYGVALGIANLGFVFGIILVALATILRRETYGIKSILWKLIIMAILVNFVLVIAAPIIGFANGLTMYFLNALPGGSTNINGGGTGLAGLKGFDNFSQGIAGIFQPQRLIAPENASTSFLTQTAGSTTNFFGTIMGGSVGLIMAIVGIAMMMIFLIVFFVMLIVRYVYLTVLLILAPFAWMFWIFPQTSKHFSNWWSKFIKQAFFPPFAMFFIWLIVKTGSNIVPGQSLSINTTAGNGLSQFIQALGYNLVAPALGTLINTFIIIGLLMGGLAAAEKMSTEGSKLAQTVVSTASKSVQGYATKQGKKLSRGVARGVGGEKIIKGLKEGNLGDVARKANLRVPFTKLNIPVGKAYGTVADSGLGKISAQIADKTGLSYAGSRLGSIVGRAAEPYLSNKDLVEAQKKDVPDDPEKMKSALKGNMDLETRLAYLSKLAEKGALKEDDKVGAQTAREFITNNRDNAKNYGQGKLLGDADKLWLSTANSRAAEDAIKKEGRDAEVKVVEDLKDTFGNVIFKQGEMVNALDLVHASLQKLLEGMDNSDLGKIDVNTKFGPSADEESRNSLLAMVGLYGRNGALGTLIKKAKSPTLRSVSGAYEAAIPAGASSEKQRLKRQVDALNERVKKLQEARDSLKPEELDKHDKEIQNVQSAAGDTQILMDSLDARVTSSVGGFRRSLMRSMVGGESEGGGGGGGAAPAPAPGGH